MLHDLAVEAEQFERPSQVAPDVMIHIRTENFWDGHGFIRERAEDEAAIDFDPQRFQAVLLRVEILRHAALATNAVAEGDTVQLAVQIVCPGVVDAGKILAVAPFLQADQRSLVGATVDHRMDVAVFVARDDDGNFADEGGLEVARVRDVDIEAQEMPDWSPEYLFLFQGVDVRVRIKAIGDASDASFGPFKGTVRSFRSGFGHGEST